PPLPSQTFSSAPASEREEFCIFLLTLCLYISIMKVKAVEGGDDNGAERDRGSGRWMHARSAPPEPLDEVRKGSALRVRASSEDRKEVWLPRPADEPLRVGDPLHESPLPRRRGGRGEGLRREEPSMMTGGYRPGYVPGKVKMSVYVDPLVHRALRMRAAETGVSMGEIVERYVRDDIRMAKYLRLTQDEEHTSEL